MNASMRSKIDSLAEKIREACELSTPVKMEDAVKKLGGQLDWIPSNGEDFEAKIEKIKNGFKITLVEAAYEKRERFSIAHELGHLFLHMGYLLDPEKWKYVGTYTDSVYYRYGYTIEENEANEFAAAFLMPESEFLDVAEKHKTSAGYLLEPISRHFDVSKDAARNRGRWLRIFSWEE